MNMKTAKMRLSTSSIVFWHGKDYRITEANDNLKTVGLQSVHGYHTEHDIEVSEVKE